MDSQEDAEEYDAMDFREANQRFADHALRLIEGGSPVRALDVGTGNADIPLLMLPQRPDLTILGVDMAEAMMDVARRKIAAARVGDRFELARMDAKALDLPAGADRDAVVDAMKGHVLASGELIGTYTAPSSVSSQ